MNARSAQPVRTPVRRSETGSEKFAKKTDWPFFGTILGKRRYIAPQHLTNVAGWIAQRSYGFLSEEALDRYLSACEKTHPSWFLYATAIRLAEASRDLQPGIHIFQATSNFTKIADPNAPAAVADRYTEAILGNPDRTFIYLEPLWHIKNGNRTSTTTQGFQTLLAGQREAIKAMVPKMAGMLCVTAIATPVIETISNTMCILAAAPFILLWKLLQLMASAQEHAAFNLRTYAQMKERYVLRQSGYDVIGHRDMTFADAAKTLFLPISMENLNSLAMKYDPIIVFSIDELQDSFDNEVPVALVAHWD